MWYVHVCAVRVCGSKRCKTCTHVSQGSTFKSTVTHKNYSVVSPNLSMTCDSENVIYLITCRKCGIQYVGETGQKLRSRVNNHRNRLRQLSILYLYQHFNSDGHSEEDISIMPIEEVTCTSGSTGVSLSAKRLEREDYWYRELCTVYPYGLNDNVRKVGNVSKCSQEMVVNTLFNRQPRKFKKRQQQRHRRKVDLADLAAQVDTSLSEYKSYTFCFNFRNLVLNLPKKCMMALSTIIDNWVATNDVPDRVMVLAKDLIAYKKRAPRMETNDVMKNSKNASGFMTVHYHNKGIEMLELPRILNSKSVKDAIPAFLSHRKPPMVSYSYTKTISGQIFNQKRVVEELDFDIGTEDMHCNCSTCDYCYEPAGHVVTGDLNIIRDAKLRTLIAKGPPYREQNSINWRVNEEICRQAVSAYKIKWSKREAVDLRVLNEWELKVNECIARRIQLLRRKHINRRKQHVLKSRRHLDYLHEFQRKFVLVPADKAANNVIVVCKKYYLEVVLRELNTTSTYEREDRDCVNVVTEHLRFMTNNKINVEPELHHLPSFYWLPKLHKQPYGTRFIAASNKCSTKPLSKLLTTCLSKITCHFKQYCTGIYSRTGVNCFWIVDNSQKVLSSLNKIIFYC